MTRGIYLSFFDGKLKVSPFVFLSLGVMYYVEGFVSFLVILFSALIHELGHLLFIRLKKSRVLYVEIHPFGGVIGYDFFGLSYLDDVLISISGGLFNIVFALIGAVCFAFFPFVEVLLFVFANLFFLVFNLTPLKGNDGYNAIFYALQKNRSLQEAEKAADIFALIALVLWFSVCALLYSVSGASPVVGAIIVFLLIP